MVRGGYASSSAVSRLHLKADNDGVRITPVSEVSRNIRRFKWYEHYEPHTAHTNQ